MITKLAIEAVSIKKTKKDGTPYTWLDKKSNTRKNRTMVSIKDSNGEWYMGWSYRDGSPAEQLSQGQVVEVVVESDTVSGPDGDKVFKSWKFPKQEDRDAQQIADLKAQLAKAQAVPQQNVGVVTLAQSTSVAAPVANQTAQLNNPAALDKPPF